MDIQTKSRDDTTTAVGLVVYKNKVLMLKRNNPPLNWCPPCGRVNVQETIYDGLRREVKEESGLTVDVGPFVSSWEGMHDGKKLKSFTFLCYANTDVVQLSEEHCDYCWVPIEEIATWKSKTDFEVAKWSDFFSKTSR